MEYINRHLCSKTPRLFQQKHGIDFWLLGCVLLLCLTGLLMVYDASQFEAFQSFKDAYYYIKQQGISFILGISFLVFLIFFDYHKLGKIALPAFIFSFFLLILVFVPGLGISAYGAHRWLKIAGFTIQPAELIKLSAIIFFAGIFQNRTKIVPLFLSLFFVAVIVGVLQKDLGSTIIFGVIALSVYFLAGAPIIHFLGLATAAILGAFGSIFLAPYRIKRILGFIDPFSDPQGYTYHISQILIAIGSGGIFGLGIGQSRQKFAYIPEATTDSIFAIVGEEFGFLGCTVVIILFGFLAWRGFKIAENAPDNFGKLIAGGIVVWLAVQSAVNLAAMSSLIPLTGVPLPFISFGGSSLVVNLIAVGILLNISRQTRL